MLFTCIRRLDTSADMLGCRAVAVPSTEQIMIHLSIYKLIKWAERKSGSSQNPVHPGYTARNKNYHKYVRVRRFLEIIHCTHGRILNKQSQIQWLSYLVPAPCSYRSLPKLRFSVKKNFYYMNQPHPHPTMWLVAIILIQNMHSFLLQRPLKFLLGCSWVGTLGSPPIDILSNFWQNLAVFVFGGSRGFVDH